MTRQLGPGGVTSALDNSIANLTNAANVDVEAQALADIPLSWDGSGWSRHTRNAERAVNAFGDSIPEQSIDVGWTVWTLQSFTRAGDHRSGLVWDISDHDPETGEQGTVYLAAYDERTNGHTDIHRLVVAHVEVAEAVPPSRAELARMLRACHERSGRLRKLDTHLLWLSGTLVPRWQGVMAHNGWIK